MKARIALALLLIGLLSLATGCNHSTPTASSSGEVNEKVDIGSPSEVQLTRGGEPPAEDDTLVRVYNDDPDTLNLITASDAYASEFQRPVYEHLARRRYDNPREWELQLAESFEFDEENLEFTIHLRKGVMWHAINLPNGQELEPREFTSRDVKFTFDTVLNEHVEAAQLRSYYLDPDPADPDDPYMIDVNVVDKYTVKVQWRKPYFLADDWTLMVQIMPRHVYSVDENGEPISFDFSSKEFADGFNNHWANSKACGTGPMILQEWKKGEEVVFVRNPAYWGAPVYFSRLVYRHISNNNTALQQLLQNDIDYGSIPQIDHYIQSKEHENVKAGKVELLEFRRTAYRFMGYNLQREIFSDRRVRTALSHATAVDGIIKEIYHGLANRMTGPFMPDGPFSNPDVEPIPFDLDKARQLLEEAGWTDTNNNGIRDKEIDGVRVDFEFDLMIYSDSPQYLSIAQIIKDDFRKIGVDVQISPAKWALFLQKLNKKEFDAMILGWVFDWKNDPFQLWHGSQADLLDSSNMGYQNPQLDKLIEKLRVTMNEDEQIPLYHEIHRLLHEDQPYTFLYSEKATAAKHQRLQNMQFYSAFRPHTDYREWYTTSARALGE